MSAETIALIIKWGPLALVAIVFLWCFILGVIRGSYKVFRRLLYVVLYVVLIWVFITPITNFVLDLNITINGVKGVRNFIINMIESSDSVNKFLSYSTDLKTIIYNSPEIILSPILFIVLIVFGLPLLLPIYWVYLLIFNLIAKHVFKRRKYNVDENGNVLRDEKGKKIKVERKKKRLLGGFLRGAQGVFLICVTLLPVNFVNRIYNKAKSKAELNKGETLCDTNVLLENNKELCGYIDLYNETIFAKMGGEKSLDKIVTDKMTTIEYNGKKVNLENEVSNIVISAVLLNDSGVLDLFINNEFNLYTVDFSSINFDKLDELIDYLFNSSIITELTETGIKYVLNEVLDDKLVDLLKDNDIVSKLEYQNSNEIKRELKDVVSILKLAVEKNIDDAIIDNRKDIVSIVNNLNEEDVEALLNKILSLRIVSKAMPSALKAYGEKYGVRHVDEMTSELNSEISSLAGDAIKFVKTMEVTKLKDLTEGNLVENLSNALFANGALKENSKDSLATLLNNLNNSYLFKDVVTTSVNKLLDDKDYKVDARVLKYVTTKEEWLKELDVLEKAYVLYDEYKTDETINYSNVTSLLNGLSSTKVLISVLPFAYDELLPKIGIEIDSEGLPVIDFDNENEDSSKKEFYDTWESELVILKNIADAAGDLKLQSLADINLELLKDEDKVESLSIIMGEVYSSPLLKEPMVEYMKDTINGFVTDYGVDFSKEELLLVDTKDKWKNELSNINNILEIDLENVENINSTNLNTIFESVENMQLFTTKKVKILKFAIEKSNFLSEEEQNTISWPLDSASQNEIDAFWDNETDVLVNIVDKKNIVEGLSSITIETLDTNEVGALLNETMKSNILKPIVVNKVSELLVANDVKDDRDAEGETINLKNTISSIDNWKVELDSIKEMVTSIDKVIETTYEEIKNDNRFNRSGSEGSYTYTQNNDGIYLKKGIDFYLIDSSYRFNRSGSEGSYTYTQNNDGAYLKISTTMVDEIFETIETSELLQNSRAGLLLKAVETIDITEIPSNVTVTELMKNEYSLYEDERDIIVKVSKNKNVFDNIAKMDLKDINTNEIGDLLDTVTSSLIFEDYVVDQIKVVLTSNQINDDNGDENNLKRNIASVNDDSSWKVELSRIQNMLNLTEETFDDKVDGKTNVTRMFETIEDSVLLQDCRASILIKIINTVAISGVSVPNGVTSQSLAATIENVEYAQYTLETNVLKAFAENTTIVNNLGSDIGSLDSSSKTYIANLLDAMKYSKIFSVKYVNTVESVLDNIDNAIDDSGYIGVSVNRGDASNKYVNISWAKEIDLLSTVSANIEEVSTYNSTNIIENTEIKIANIGTTLTAVESSSFLGKSSAEVIANSVLSAIKGSSVTITKGVNETWEDAFLRELGLQ